MQESNCTIDDTVTNDAIIARDFDGFNLSGYKSMANKFPATLSYAKESRVFDVRIARLDHHIGYADKLLAYGRSADGDVSDKMAGITQARDELKKQRENLVKNSSFSCFYNHNGGNGHRNIEAKRDCHKAHQYIHWVTLPLN